jgi:Fe-Mn family superoxide dismutase
MYQARDYKALLGTAGFSDDLLNSHFMLYEAYVAQVNKLADLLRLAEVGTPAYSEMKRRFGWEFNGMRLHELYFGGMVRGGKPPHAGSRLARQIAADFGSQDAWARDFKATGAARGVGWAMLAFDPLAERLFNLWINEHDTGVLAGCQPVLTLDVFEHAYMNDYGLKKPDYLAAFMAAVDWAGAEKSHGGS